MVPTLYMFHASAPVRAVLITAKAIGLDLEEKEVHFKTGAHLRPNFLKLNPQHTVPTLVDDDDFAIWDSHAIMVYLISKYAKNDCLYPQDVKKRAIIDQRLHFESGVVFAVLKRISIHILIKGKQTLNGELKKSVKETYEFLETFLEGKLWVVGDYVSIADYSLVSSISSLNTIVPIDPEKWPKITAWLRRSEQLLEYEANNKGLKIFADTFRKKLTTT